MSGADSGTMLRILVVDDQQDLRETTQYLLEIMGYEAASAGSSEEALPMVQAQRYDVLLTDLSLPGMNGLDLADKARLLQPQIAVVISSGYAKPADTQDPPRTWRLPKPYGFDDLSNMLESIRGA